MFRRFFRVSFCFLEFVKRFVLIYFLFDYVEFREVEEDGIFSLYGVKFLVYRGGERGLRKRNVVSYLYS